MQHLTLTITRPRSSFSSMTRTLSSLLLLLLLPISSVAFYLPGVYPLNLKPGDEIKLQVDSLRSQHTLPLKPYSLPFCAPAEPESVSENLGEFLLGEKKFESLYRLNMKGEVYCKQVSENANKNATKEQSK